MMSLIRTGLVLAVVATLTPTVMGQSESFRGLPLDQGSNLHSSPVLGLDDLWFIDIKERFTGYSDLQVGTDAHTRSDSSPLIDTYVDDLRIGFVPPLADVPPGPLVGDAASRLGRWMGTEGYVLTPDHGGSVRLAGDHGDATVCLPWRVTPELGDAYLIEMTAFVAEGESTRLAYFGDVGTHSPTGGLLESGLGQLVLDVTRGTGDLSDQLNWTVDWEGKESDAESVSGIIHSDLGAELALKLGWHEDTNNFDAWIDDLQLASGDMGTVIDVHGVGFELTGTGSRVTSLLAAVPEPSSLYLMATALVLLLGRRRGC